MVDRELSDGYKSTVRGELKLANRAIVVQDTEGDEAVMKWIFSNAFPCRWSGPELDAGHSRVAIEELGLCHDRLRRADLTPDRWNW